MWGPGESGLPERWESVVVRGMGSASDSLVASDEVQGHLICKMHPRTALPSFWGDGVVTQRLAQSKRPGDAGSSPAALPMSTLAPTGAQAAAAH